MTKTGNDSLKRRARQIASGTGRRFPDVLAELRGQRGAAPAPSTELVLLCPHFAHPLDPWSGHPTHPGRCTRPAGHEQLDGIGTWLCSDQPHLPAHIWRGYQQAEDAAYEAQHDAQLASMSPAERQEYEATSSFEEMTADDVDPYSREEEKAYEIALDIADEGRWAEEMDNDDADDPYGKAEYAYAGDDEGWADA